MTATAVGERKPQVKPRPSALSGPRLLLGRQTDDTERRLYKGLEVVNRYRPAKRLRRSTQDSQVDGADHVAASTGYVSKRAIMKPHQDSFPILSSLGRKAELGDNRDDLFDDTR